MEMLDPWARHGPVALLFLFVGMGSVSAISFAAIHAGRDPQRKGAGFLRSFGWFLQAFLAVALLGGWLNASFLRNSQFAFDPSGPYLDDLTRTLWFTATAYTLSFGVNLFLARVAARPKRLPTSFEARVVVATLLAMSVALTVLAWLRVDGVFQECRGASPVPMGLPCDQIRGESIRLVRVLIWLDWLLLGAFVYAQVRSVQPKASQTPTEL